MNVHDKDEMSDSKNLNIVRKLETTTVTDVLDLLNISRSWYSISFWSRFSALKLTISDRRVFQEKNQMESTYNKIFAIPYSVMFSSVIQRLRKHPLCGIFEEKPNAI